MVYVVQWSYRSGTVGPWGKGLEVDLAEAQAAAINADSPGVLVPAGAPAPVADADAGPSARDIAEPPNTRQVTAADARRAPGRPRKAAGA